MVDALADDSSAKGKGKEDGEDAPSVRFSFSIPDEFLPVRVAI